MTSEMFSKTETGWHLDKRISVTHIFATLSFATALAAWLWALDTRITVVEGDIVKHEEVTSLQMSVVEKEIQGIREDNRETVLEMNRHYQEILALLNNQTRRLERIEDRINTYIDKERN